MSRTIVPYNIPSAVLNVDRTIYNLNIGTADNKVDLFIPYNTSLQNNSLAPLGQINIICPAATLPAAPTGQKIIRACDFGEQNARFDPEIRMVFNYDNSEVTGTTESTFYIAGWNGTSWVPVNTGFVLDQTNNKAEALVSHFSIYGLLGTIASAAPDCSACSPWQNASTCGTNGCLTTQRARTRTGCPTGCESVVCLADSSCSSGGGGGGTTGTLIKIADDARNPSVGVDSKGNVHVAYDCNCRTHTKGYVECYSLCYAKVYSENGTILVNNVFDVANPVSTMRPEGHDHIILADSRLQIDPNDNVHLSWNWGYAIITPEMVITKNDDGGLFPAVEDGAKGGVYTRLAVNRNGEAYILYQMGNLTLSGRTVDPSLERTIRLKKMTPSATETWTIEVDNSCSGEDKTKNPGNILIDDEGIAHISWHNYCDDDKTVKYIAFDTNVDSFVPGSEVTIMGSMSNNTDMELDADNTTLHFVAATTYARDGLAYRTMNKSSLALSPLYYLYSPINGDSEAISSGASSQVVFQASERFGEADTIGGALKQDVLGEVYLSFAGAGDTILNPATQPSGYNRKCNIGPCYYYVAYYTKLNATALNTAPVNNNPALTKFVPAPSTERTAESDQGTANSNPLIGKAWNQGVFMVFEDDYVNPLFNVYLKTVGGAMVGKPQLKADLNCNSKVDVVDLGIMMSCWLNSPLDINVCVTTGVIPATCKRSPDINNDAAVNNTDFGMMLSCWGTSTNPTCFE